MARQTKKYTAACSMLGLPHNADIPHAAVYGMLALRGFEWSGQAWVNNSKLSPHAASVRISCEEGYLPTFASMIEDLLISLGCKITSEKGPYKNREGKQARFYINFKFED